MAETHRIPLRMPPELASDLAFLAKIHGRSVNAELIDAATTWLTHHREEINAVREEMNRLSEQLREPLAQMQQVFAVHQSAFQSALASLPSPTETARMVETINALTSARISDIQHAMDTLAKLPMNDIQKAADQMAKTLRNLPKV